MNVKIIRRPCDWGQKCEYEATCEGLCYFVGADRHRRLVEFYKSRFPKGAGYYPKAKAWMGQRGPKVKFRRRDIVILERIKAGERPSDVALDYGVGKQRIGQICKKVKLRIAEGAI